MKGLGSINENKIQGIQNKNKEENLVKFNCSNHTNGKSGTIGEKHYDKIFCLDNSNLTEVYKILHDKENFSNNVAFVLNSDLDFSKSKEAGGLDYESLNKKYYYKGNTFAPIGSDNNKFNASFYGNNHKITVGDINYPDEDNVGFFGYIGKGGKVYDLQLKIGDVNGKKNIGGFVGENNYGKIENSSTVVISISGSSFVGGFIGYNEYGTIKNSSTVVNSVSGIDWDVGGFIGLNKGKIEKSSVVVNFVKSDSRIGSFVGGNEGTIKKSSVVVNSVSGSNKVGGFVGENNYGKIENSSAVVNFVKGDSNVGGFIGLNNEGTIENSSAVVNSVSGSNKVGGFVGRNYHSTIENSVARVLDGNSNNVSAGYYQGSSNTFTKEQFFFNDTSIDNGLRYDNGHLYIPALSGSEIEFNNVNFHSAFSDDNSNWGNTIMINLSNYWKNW